MIEANPRASRTVPFVSKAIGLPLAKLACRIVLGERLAELALPAETSNGHVCVKEAVLPFDRFTGSDSLLGPEMRSTGEVMGIARDFPTAFAKAQAAAGAHLPSSGTVFITVADGDKPAATGVATVLHDLGFRIIATRGTAQAIRRMGIPAEAINKIGEGSPHVVDWIERGEVDLVINTPVGTGARADGYEIRTAAVARGIPCITTMAGAIAAARAISAARRGEPEVLSLQEIHGKTRDRRRERRSSHRPVRPPRRHDHRARAARRLHRAPLRRPRRTQAPRRAVLHAHGGDAVGRGRGRAAVPPPRVQRAAGAGRAPTSSNSWSRTSARARSACAELDAGDELLLVGPLGNGFGPPREGRRPLLVGGGVGIAPLAILQDELGPATEVLLGFRGADHAPGAGLLGAAAVATDDGSSVGHHGLVTELLEPELDADDRVEVYACGPPPMLEAVRRICAEHEVPAQLALESGMACGFGACFGCVVPTRDGYCALVPRRPRARRRCARHRRPRRSGPLTTVFCGLELAHPIINASGTFDAIAARRAFGDELLDRFPFAAFVSKTVTVQPRQGNPPPRLWEAAERHDQLDRSAQQGPRGLPGPRSPGARAAAGTADRERDGVHPRRVFAAGRRLRRTR